MSDPVGVVLAAGFATRMGRPKQLLPYGESTILGGVLTVVAASRLTRTVVVLGAYADAICAAVDLDGLETVTNPEPDRGNLSSLLVAAEAAPHAPLLLMMGDAPGLTTSVIDAHLEAWDADRGWLRATQYSDGLAHPLMLSPELIAGLDEGTTSKPLWPLVHSERAEKLVIDAPAPVDIDTPEDYARALAEAAGSAD